MNTDQTIQELLRGLGLPARGPGADGRYPLVFDDELALSLTPGGGGALIEGEVAVLPTDPDVRERLLRGLLAHGAAAMAQGAEVVHLDGHGVTVLLSRRLVREECSLASLRQALSEFVSALEHWRGVAAPERAPGAGGRGPLTLTGVTR